MQGLETHASLRFFLPLQETIHPQDWYVKEMKLEDIGIKLTFLTKCF